jgi:hypothetical protein
MNQGMGYVLPSRSRMGDDTPGHKADPTKRGVLARSKPAGLMFLALQSLQEEERQMVAQQGEHGCVASSSAAAVAAGVDLSEGPMHEAGVDVDGMGTGTKMQYIRKRSNKTSNRLLDRKSALSMRLKSHWKAKDVALSHAKKNKPLNNQSFSVHAAVEGLPAVLSSHSVAQRSVDGDGAHGSVGSMRGVPARRRPDGVGTDVGHTGAGMHQPRLGGHGAHTQAQTPPPNFLAARVAGAQQQQGMSSARDSAAIHLGVQLVALQQHPAPVPHETTNPWLERL